MGGVEVHVFGEAVGVEEIVAGPAFGGIGEIGGVEVYGDFVAGAVDYVLFVYFFNEIRYVAVAGVVADLPRVGAGGAYLLVDVAQIVDGVAFDYAGVAAEIELRAGQGNLGDFERNIAGGIIHADAVPVNFQVRGDADEARA